MRGLKISMVFAVAFLGALASLAPACGGTGEGETGTNSGGAGCTPGKSEACVCTNGNMGAQVCQPNGSFGPCSCGGGEGGGGAGGAGGAGGGTSLCGNDKMDPGEQCDDGNNLNGDGCNSLCMTETCGNGMPEPGECGPEGTCPMDCGLCGNMNEDPGECGPTGACPEDCCLPQNTQIYQTMIPSSGPVWSYAGLTGLDAGNEQCKSLGADHACTYEEIREAEMQGELAGIASGTTMWLHRTTQPMMPAGLPAPGAGCRCNDWKYNTNHISDGEFGVMGAAGAVTYNFDTDCTFDANNPGMYTLPGLQCGGENRAIFCCFAQCVKPMP